MRTGQVWKFPIGKSRASGYCRVVLEMKELELQPESQLALVRSCVLLQVSKQKKLTDESFDKGNLLHDAAFVYRDGPWRNHGFEYVCDLPVAIDEVELPCTFLFRHYEKSGFKCQFNRGECLASESDLTHEELHAKWGRCYVSMTSAAGFTADYANGANAVRFVRSIGHLDARYHQHAAEILRENNVDLSVPYCDLLPTARRLFYEQAVAVPAKSR